MSKKSLQARLKRFVLNALLLFGFVTFLYRFGLSPIDIELKSNNYLL